jgi:hypothetical protein
MTTVKQTKQSITENADGVDKASVNKTSVNKTSVNKISVNKTSGNKTSTKIESPKPRIHILGSDAGNLSADDLVVKERLTSLSRVSKDTNFAEGRGPRNSLNITLNKTIPGFPKMNFETVEAVDYFKTSTFSEGHNVGFPLKTNDADG